MDDSAFYVRHGAVLQLTLGYADVLTIFRCSKFHLSIGWRIFIFLQFKV